MQQQQIQLSVTKQAIDWLATEGFNPEFGARPIKRLIQKRVLNALSKQMLEGRVKPNSRVVLDVFDDEVVFRAPLTNESVD